MKHGTKEWQSRARGVIDEAANALEGSAGMAYLERRGITLETCKRFSIGYRERVPVPFGPGDLHVPVLPDERDNDPRMMLHYERVTVWMDSREKIEAAIAKHPTARLRWIASPRDHDANDILVRYGPAILRDLILAR